MGQYSPTAGPTTTKGRPPRTTVSPDPTSDPRRAETEHGRPAPALEDAGPLFRAVITPEPDVRTTERAAHLEATGTQVRPRGRRSLARILARLRRGPLTVEGGPADQRDPSRDPHPGGDSA